MGNKPFGDNIFGFYITKGNSEEKLEFKEYCLDDDTYYLNCDSERKRIKHMNRVKPGYLYIVCGGYGYHVRNNILIMRESCSEIDLVYYNIHKDIVFYRMYIKNNDFTEIGIVDIKNKSRRKLVTCNFRFWRQLWLVKIEEARADLIEDYFYFFWNPVSNVKNKIKEIRYEMLYLLEKRLQTFENCEMNLIGVIAKYMINRYPLQIE